MSGLVLTRRGRRVIDVLLLAGMALSILVLGLLAVHAMDTECQHALDTGTTWRIDRACGRQ